MEENNIQKKHGDSVRRIVLTGVFVFAVAAIVSSVNTAEQEVALYPVEVVSQSANVVSAVESMSTKTSGSDSIDVRSIPGSITIYADSDDFIERECPGGEGLSFGTVGGSNCSYTPCGGVAQTGYTVLTSADIDECGGWDTITSDSTFYCLVDRCLMPTGVDLDILENVPNIDIDIQLGGVHPVVLEIEQKLQAKGFFKLTPDQTFGYKTLDAIKAFQTANRLPATGILNSQTISLLRK